MVSRGCQGDGVVDNASNQRKLGLEGAFNAKKNQGEKLKWNKSTCNISLTSWPGYIFIRNATVINRGVHVLYIFVGDTYLTVGMLSAHQGINRDPGSGMTVFVPGDSKN